MYRMAFHSFASTRKCYSQLFSSFKKQEELSIFRRALLYLNHPSPLSEGFLVWAVASIFSSVTSALWLTEVYQYYNCHKACSLFSPLITFSISQQYRTYLSTASVWFSHSSELLSLPKSAAQLALLLEWPIPLLGVGKEDRGTNNRKSIMAKHLNCYRYENRNSKVMYL